MQIRGLLSGGTGPALLGSGGEASKSTTPAAAKTDAGAAASGPSAASSNALREILGRYDVTDITPEDFSQMLDKLHRAGAISDKEFSELSGIRLELQREGARPDEEINLLRFYLERLQRTERDAASNAQAAPETSLLRRRTEWLQKAALVQSSGLGIDAAA